MEVQASHVISTDTRWAFMFLAIGMKVPASYLAFSDKTLAGMLGHLITAL